MAPRGLVGALLSVNDGDSESARYEGGRRVWKEVCDVVEPRMLLEADDSGVGGLVEGAIDSGEAGVSGSELMAATPLPRGVATRRGSTRTTL